MKCVWRNCKKSTWKNILAMSESETTSKLYGTSIEVKKGETCAGITFSLWTFALKGLITLTRRPSISHTLLLLKLESHYFSFSFKFAQLKFAHPKVERRIIEQLLLSFKDSDQIWMSEWYSRLKNSFQVTGKIKE